MKKTAVYILIGSISAIVVYILVASPTENKEKSEFRSKTTDKTQQFTEQESIENDVVIVVKPKVLKVAENPRFEVQFNTHSVNLDFDVSKISKVVDDSGNEYTNSNWEGSAAGGHHRSGFLTFDEPLKETSYIFLIMQDEDSIKEQSFKWKI